MHPIITEETKRNLCISHNKSTRTEIIPIYLNVFSFSSLVSSMKIIYKCIYPYVKYTNNYGNSIQNFGPIAIAVGTYSSARK